MCNHVKRDIAHGMDEIANMQSSISLGNPARCHLQGSVEEGKWMRR